MPIEILHLAYATFPADPRVRREALAARDTGRRVAVVALRSPGAPPVQRQDGLTVIRLPGRKSRGGFIPYLLQYAAFVWRCRRLVARHPRLRHVQLVHVHTLPDFLMWAATPARRRGAKLVFDMHEIFPEFVQCKFRGLAGRAAAAIARALERQARSRADLTIVVNHPIAELLDTRLIGRPRPERRIVIHNAADPGDFGPSLPAAPPPPPPPPPHPRDPAAIHLVYHGTLTRLYGVDVAISSVARARRTGGGVDVRLTILGDGPQKPELERLIAQLGVAPAVRLEAPLPANQLPGALRRADAGLVPTRLDGMTRYSLSNKLLEYVHLGIPVLAARLPSYDRYLDDASAWFWSPGDANDLVRAIVAFARSTQEERAARAAAAQACLQDIAWPLERARLLQAYDELLTPDVSRSARIPAIRAAARPSP